jgi:hypothetical protein
VLQAAAGELVLVRFSPMNTEKFIEQANDHAAELASYSLEPVYAVSTYGDILGEEETTEALVTRVCEEAGCGGRRIWLAAGRTLRQEGYDAVLSEPPPHHYDVIIGREQDVPDADKLAGLAAKLVGLFEPGRERNPAWKRS